MPDFIAYIDEAGDEGFGKLKSSPAGGGQSRWLMIGACIVTAEHDAKLASWRNAIVTKLKHGRLDLHFRDLNHNQRVMVSEEIAKLPVAAALTLSHKSQSQDRDTKSRLRKMVICITIL
jgi:hypothetical protein